eukprot:Selendium_serpulae@DN5863_c0_g3_i3.p1
MGTESQPDGTVPIINAYAKRYHNSCVRCEATDDKGRILVSAKEYTAGEEIFSEGPLHAVQVEPENKAYQRLAALCEAESFDLDPVWYWCALNSLTAVDGQPSYDGLSTVSPSTQQRILTLFAPEAAVGREVKVLRKHFDLEDHPADLVEKLLQVWVHNCFEHKDDPVGYIMIFMVSFASHSCIPNAIWHITDDEQFVLKARRIIRKGEEICLSYLSEEALFEPTSLRQKNFESTKGFQCTCPRCLAEVDPSRGFRCPSCVKGTVFFAPSTRAKTKKNATFKAVPDITPPKPIFPSPKFTPDSFELMDSLLEKSMHTLHDGQVARRIPVGEPFVCTRCHETLDPGIRNSLILREREIIKAIKAKSGEEDDDDDATDDDGSRIRDKANEWAEVSRDVKTLFSQHWVTTKWLSCEVSSLRAKQQWADAAAAENMKISFLQQMHPCETGHLAWSLELLADMLLSALGLTSLSVSQSVSQSRRILSVDDRLKRLFTEEEYSKRNHWDCFFVALCV